MPAVDLSVLTALVGDDPLVVDEILLAFQKSAAQSRGELRQAMRVDSMKSAADAAHKLKSAALSVGALRLGELCAEIERAAQAQRAAEVEALLPLHEAELDAVQRFLDAR